MENQQRQNLDYIFIKNLGKNKVEGRDEIKRDDPTNGLSFSSSYMGYISSIN